jgi:hypothetical protein
MTQPIETIGPADLVTVSEAVQALCQRGNVTWEEYEGLSLNGFERDALYPHLETAALCQATEQIRAHCLPQRHFPTVTYDEALTHRLVPLLLERLREQAEQLDVERGSGR